MAGPVAGPIAGSKGSGQEMDPNSWVVSMENPRKNWEIMYGIYGIIWLRINILSIIIIHGVWLLISGSWLTYPSEKYESVGMMKFPN